VEGSPKGLANLFQQLCALFLAGSAQDHLLSRFSVLVYPAKRVAEKVEWLSCSEVDGSGLFFVHREVEFPQFFSESFL
jgi:hypothetical protein